MNGSLIAAAVIMLLTVSAFGLMIINMNRFRRNSFRDELKKRWGIRRDGDPGKYPEPCHMHYADSCPNGQESSSYPEYGFIDDITWKDIEMDRFLAHIDVTWTGPGYEVLIHWLRHPVISDRSALEFRDRLITWLETYDQERAEIAGVLYTSGLDRKGSVYDAVRAVEQAEPVSTFRFVIPALLTLAGLAGLFIKPVPSLILLIVMFAVNFRIRMNAQADYRSVTDGFACLEGLLKASDRLQNTYHDSEELRVLLDEAKNASKVFGNFRKGAFLLGSGNQTGISQAVLTYLNLFFHLDMIRYNRMLLSVREHMEEAMILFRTVGTIDAAWSAASWRAGGSDWCRPDLSCENQGINLRGMHHPLMNDPVPNDCVTDTGFLLTGSNASGKSTYLKGCALSAIMAQTIASVPAVSYSAPFFSVFTSIALTDNLRGGESYYVVEIRSLKRILDAAGSGHPVLAMADEVLRGTNTVERIASSASILRKLREEGVIILAATHDIELSYMLETILPNRHFGETIDEGDVVFDYTLREGRAEGRNAIRLLQEAGFPQDVTDRAGLSARHFEETGEWKL